MKRICLILGTLLIFSGFLGTTWYVENQIEQASHMAILTAGAYALSTPDDSTISTPLPTPTPMMHTPVVPASPLVAQGQNWTVTGPPTVTAQFLNDMLCKYHSPACGLGQSLYDAHVQYGISIDPVYALAIFWNESNFGTTGEASVSQSVGNPRCLDEQHFGDTGTWCQDGYAWFPSWQSGFTAFYRLLAGPLYVGDGLNTIDKIIPRWAPSSDHNVPSHYIAVVKACVALWRASKEQVPVF